MLLWCFSLLSCCPCPGVQPPHRHGRPAGVPHQPGQRQPAGGPSRAHRAWAVLQVTWLPHTHTHALMEGQWSLLTSGGEGLCSSLHMFFRQRVEGWSSSAHLPPLIPGSASASEINTRITHFLRSSRCHWCCEALSLSVSLCLSLSLSVSHSLLKQTQRLSQGTALAFRHVVGCVRSCLSCVCNVTVSVSSCGWSLQSSPSMGCLDLWGIRRQARLTDQRQQVGGRGRET